MPQRFTVLNIVRVDRNARHRADLSTLGLFKMSNAFSAFLRLNFVDFGAHENGLIGALRLAHIAVDALVGNDQRHG